MAPIGVGGGLGREGPPVDDEEEAGQAARLMVTRSVAASFAASRGGGGREEGVGQSEGVPDHRGGGGLDQPLAVPSPCCWYWRLLERW